MKYEDQCVESNQKKKQSDSNGLGSYGKLKEEVASLLAAKLREIESQDASILKMNMRQVKLSRKKRRKHKIKLGKSCYKAMIWIQQKNEFRVFINIHGTIMSKQMFCDFFELKTKKQLESSMEPQLSIDIDNSDFDH